MSGEPALVFAYGTLRDPACLLALFDTVPPRRAAVLADWMTVALPGGYLSIVPADGERVVGDVIALDALQLACADAWEEVPRYERRALNVVAGSEALRCWVYVCPTESRRRPPPNAFALHARSAVLAEIAQFRRRSESA